MLILLGIIFIPSTVISGLLFVLSGVICNPLILKKAQLKKRLSIPLFFIFLILGFGLFPTSEDSTAETVALQTETSSMLVETEETVIESAIESETIARESEAVVHETETVGNLEVHFLDVGQGLSVFIESDGHYMLYDGGDSSKSSFVVSYLKDQGVQTLDYVVASHYDSDHLNGVIGALHAFDIDIVIGPDYVHDSNLYQSFMDTVSSISKNVEHPSVGTEYSLGNSKFVILAPANISSDSNNNSVAVKIVNGENSFILTGDAESSSESAMCNSGLNIDCDVLCVGIFCNAPYLNMRSSLAAAKISMAIQTRILWTNYRVWKSLYLEQINKVLLSPILTEALLPGMSSRVMITPQGMSKMPVRFLKQHQKLSQNK